MIRICTTSGIPNEQFLAVQERDDILTECVEMFFAQGDVDGPPIHVVSCQRFSHGEPVLWRSTGVRARDRRERTHVGKPALSSLQRFLVKLHGREIPVHRPLRLEAVHIQSSKCAGLYGLL